MLSKYNLLDSLKKIKHQKAGAFAPAFCLAESVTVPKLAVIPRLTRVHFFLGREKLPLCSKQKMYLLTDTFSASAQCLSQHHTELLCFIKQ